MKTLVWKLSPFLECRVELVDQSRAVKREWKGRQQLSINKKEKVWTRGGLALIAKAEREGEGRRERERFEKKKKKGRKRYAGSKGSFRFSRRLQLQMCPASLVRMVSNCNILTCFPNGAWSQDRITIDKGHRPDSKYFDSNFFGKWQSAPN